MDLWNQEEMERLFNKNQTMRRLKAEADFKENQEYCESVGIPYPFALDLIAQMCLHKRILLSAMVGILRHHFLHVEGSASQACADMLVKAAEADLVDLGETPRGDLELIILLDVDPEVRAEIDQFIYPIPMLIPPKEVRSNTDVGMFTIKGSILLKDNHHEEDVCLDHINRVNKTAYRINTETVELVRNTWADLDHQRPDEEPEDYQARVKAFEKYDRVSRDVIDSLSLIGEPFYLTHRYDKRGRTYAQGYHINPQGNAWNKSIIEFAEAEVLK